MPKFGIGLFDRLGLRGRPLAARHGESVAVAGLHRDIEPDPMHPADEARHHLAAQRRDDASGFEPANRFAHRLDATAGGARYRLVAREARPVTVAVEVPQERPEYVQAGAL